MNAVSRPGINDTGALSRRFFMQLPPDGSEAAHLTIHDIIGADDRTPIITIGSWTRPINRVALDLAVAEALLVDQEIPIQPARNGTLFHGCLGSPKGRSKSEGYAPAQLEALRILQRDAVRKQTSFFDSPKISLKFLGAGPTGALVSRIGRSTYFATCLTNELSTQCFTRSDGMLQGSSTLDLFPADLAKTGRQRVLKGIEDCQELSNHLGSMILAISSDGIPVLCLQGVNARTNPGRVVMSGAGSVDLEDLAFSHGIEEADLSRVIRFAMARELFEETGGIPQTALSEEDRQRLHDFLPAVHLAGYYRDLRRGGLPIFFGFCRMRETFETLTARQYDSNGVFKAQVETSIVDQLERHEVKNAVEMLAYLEDNIRGNALFRCDPSDQMLLMVELLRLPLIQAHFDRAIARP